MALRMLARVVGGTWISLWRHGGGCLGLCEMMLNRKEKVVGKIERERRRGGDRRRREGVVAAQTMCRALNVK